MFKNYILSLLVFNLAACASFHSIKVPTGGYVPDAIYVGSTTVELVTLDGTTHKFIVTEVDEQGVGGSTGFFAYTDIKSLKVWQKNEAKAGLWLILGGLVIAAMVIAVSAGSSAGEAGCIFNTETGCPQ
jgi:hypothetical protein